MTSTPTPATAGVPTELLLEDFRQQCTNLQGQYTHMHNRLQLLPGLNTALPPTLGALAPGIEQRRSGPTMAHPVPARRIAPLPRRTTSRVRSLAVAYGTETPRPANSLTGTRYHSSPSPATVFCPASPSPGGGRRSCRAAMRPVRAALVEPSTEHVIPQSARREFVPVVRPRLALDAVVGEQGVKPGPAQDVGKGEAGGFDREHRKVADQAGARHRMDRVGGKGNPPGGKGDHVKVGGSVRL